MLLRFYSIKNCAQFFIYAFIAFNFFAKADFFLEAVFLTITPFVQAWSIFFVASESKTFASSTFPASTAQIS